LPLLLLGPPFFSDYSFWVHHLVNPDDWHLLAHAKASDFSVAWQCLSKRTMFFCYGSNSTPLKKVYLLYIVSEVQFGNLSLKKTASGTNVWIHGDLFRQERGQQIGNLYYLACSQKLLN
jgi:hypothetical protein